MGTRSYERCAVAAAASAGPRPSNRLWAMRCDRRTRRLEHACAQVCAANTTRRYAEYSQGYCSEHSQGYYSEHSRGGLLRVLTGYYSEHSRGSLRTLKLSSALQTKRGTMSPQGGTLSTQAAAPSERLPNSSVPRHLHSEPSSHMNTSARPGDWRSTRQEVTRPEADSP